MSGHDDQPSAVTTACWLLMLGAGLLIAGGFFTATVGFDTLRRVQPQTVSDESVRHLLVLNRGVGTLFVAAGAALAWLAQRARRRDLRFRRAAIALAMVTIVLVALVSVYAGHILALLALLPIIVGTLVLSRPAVMEWYAGG